MNGITILHLPPSAATDSTLTRHIATLISAVYTASEGDLFTVPVSRTSPDEIATHIAAGEVYVACTASSPTLTPTTESTTITSTTTDIPSPHSIIGATCLHLPSASASNTASNTARFSMLTVSPTYQDHGIGRLLADHVEAEAARRGARRLQLELLVPREGVHAQKEDLRRWYARRGFVEEAEREEAFVGNFREGLLVGPVEFLVMRKVLL